ncbi:HDIG domain-containing metalloprotein [Clostridium weizhouense]|uniref:HDIG domain-containing protein n=1 Tax=Clostridium weizhouense TaxID=2859781 RepID=A0ABS7AS56_9CLOT|nr:HDIG domain-containing metalloprotein [Clostridium weizhouense]MBW6411500.1 HDIG domain-containing protein [Clostridium weizhouense]
MKDIDIFLKIEEHLINDDKPSIFLEKELSNGTFNKYPFSMIGELKEVPQNPKFHPEGDVFIHTMMVVDEGAKNRDKSRDKRVFMWTLLLHDIGKKPTTKMRKGRLTSYDHDKVGAEMAEEFLKYFNQSEEFILQVKYLIRWHMQSLFVTKDLKFKDITGLLKDVDIDDISLVSLSDRLGRGGLNSLDREDTEKDINKFKEILIREM